MRNKNSVVVVVILVLVLGVVFYLLNKKTVQPEDTTPKTNVAEKTGGRVSEQVRVLKDQGIVFKPVDLLTPSTKVFKKMDSISYNAFTPKEAIVKDLLKNKDQYIAIQIPLMHSTNTASAASADDIATLNLYRVDSDPTNIMTSSGKKIVDETLSYRGDVDGSTTDSLASVTVTPSGEMYGLISDGTNTYNIQPIDRHDLSTGETVTTPTIVVFNVLDAGPNPLQRNDKHLDVPGVETQEHPSFDYFNLPVAHAAVTSTSRVVQWYWETDYDLFVDKGSAANVNTYIQGVFNQVKTLYANDGIPINLKTLYIWTTQDPYTGTTTDAYLNQFGSYRTSFDGNLATLIGYHGSGGIAYLGTLGFSTTQYRMSYCGISSSYSGVPSYSWTVECIAHEEGHLLGPNHTHDCVWNGNATKIDECGDVAGYKSGTCLPDPVPQLPVGGGTIMSYCDLTSAGINFTKGFGPQPAQLMVNVIENCHSADPNLCPTVTSTDTTPPVVSNVTVSNITSATATIHWTTDDASDSWVMYYSDPNVITGIPGNTNTTDHIANISSLLPSTTYYYSVKSTNSANLTSTPTPFVMFKTTTPDSTPPSAPKNLSATNTTASTTTLSWGASSDGTGSGVAGYFIYENGSTNPINSTAITATSYVVSGLSYSTTYTFQVLAKDLSGNPSALSNQISVTTLPPAVPFIVSGPTVSSITATAATITWDTDVVADTQVFFSTTAGGPYTTKTDPALVTHHSVSISGLSSNTKYYFLAKSVNVSGTATSAELNFTTLDTPDTTAPTVSITAPTGSSYQKGAVVVTATSADNVGGKGVRDVQFFVDSTTSTAIGVDATLPYSVTIDTTKYTNASHKLYAIACDNNLPTPNCRTSAAVSFYVDNLVPVTAVTAPTSNQTITGTTFTLKASATDTGSAVSKVDFYADGNLLGTDTTSAYTFAWNITTVTGTHRITSVATDKAGNTTTSSPVSVIVNPAATNQPPQVNAGSDQTIYLPTLSTTLNGFATDDNFGGSTLTTSWTKVSGPGTVAFGTPNVVTTTAMFSTSGSYTLQLYATDGTLAASDTIVINITPKPAGFFDDFNRSDSSVVGNGWQTIAGSFGIKNNKLTSTSGVQSRIIQPASFVDQTVSATFQRYNSTGASKFCLLLRYKDANNYMDACQTFGGSQQIYMAKVANGSTTFNYVKATNGSNLNTGNYYTPFTIKASAIGSTYSMTLTNQDGTYNLVPFTDTTLTQGMSGIMIGASAGLDTIDEFNIQ